MRPSTLMQQYAALMTYFADAVSESTKELHAACGGKVTFEGEPVNYDTDIMAPFDKVDRDYFDFLLIPPIQSACLTAYGVTHLLTRSKSRYAVSSTYNTVYTYTYSPKGFLWFPHSPLIIESHLKQQWSLHVHGLFKRKVFSKPRNSESGNVGRFYFLKIQKLGSSFF